MNKKGFTLVELLAVIAILAILVIIALPNVLNMFNNAKKDIFLTEAKNIYKEVSKKYISETTKGNNITKISNNKNKLDIESNNLNYGVNLDHKGNIKHFQVSDGTYCLCGKFSSLNELTIDKINNGECEKYDDISPEPVYCKFDGELTTGAEFVKGDYTYRYKQEGKYVSSGNAWHNIYTTGWGVQLTNKESTDPVTSELCTYINGKKVVSTAYMFSTSKTTSVDLSSFNTSNVTNMSSMFRENKISSIKGLDGFNTSKVTDMSQMFYRNSTKEVNLSSFDTRNVTSMHEMFSYSFADKLDLSNFNTKNVKNMFRMFEMSRATLIDLSNFDTRNVTNMKTMFNGSTNLKTIYTSDKFVTTNVTDGNYMFTNCTSLVGGQGTTYDSTKTDKTYARIDGGTSNFGYFTKK